MFRSICDVINIELINIGFRGVDWVQVAQDRNKWWTLVTTIEKPLDFVYLGKFVVELTVWLFFFKKGLFSSRLRLGQLLV